MARASREALPVRIMLSYRKNHSWCRLIFNNRLLSRMIHYCIIHDFPFKLIQLTPAFFFISLASQNTNNRFLFHKQTTNLIMSNMCIICEPEFFRIGSFFLLLFHRSLVQTCI